MVKDVSQIIGRPVPSGWEELFDQARDNLEHIYQIRARKGHINSSTLAPREEDIFRAFDLVRPEDVHVILIAQDPYHSVATKTSRSGQIGRLQTVEQTNLTGPPVADGLAFSSRHGVQPSLRNIIGEIRRLWPSQTVNWSPSGQLEGWARQGVLLLNASLTTELGTPGAHGYLWYIFLQNVFTYLKKRAERGQTFVVLRLGRNAQKIRGLDSSLGLCLDSGHPSPMNRNPKTAFNGDVLVKVNEHLRAKGVREIEWWSME